MINKITFPASTLSRAFRYYKKGFTMCLGEIKKLIDAIKEEPKGSVKDDGDESEDDKSSGDLMNLFMGFD
jgi:hypothetical protein